MATFWTYPNTIAQYVETGAEDNHISWNNISLGDIISNDKLSVVTNKNLYHIARSPKHDLVTKTFFLKITNFKFQNLPVAISGIEMRLTANRRGRIMDDTVQLLLNDEPIGDNKASLEILQTKIYGSPTDLWNANLTISDLNKNNFGLLLRFKSHIKWPHSDPIFVNCVELRIH
jgi:hypothetical protein